MNSALPESPAAPEASPLFAVKMRASCAGVHVSGAERIVPAEGVAPTVAALAERALGHSRGGIDFMNIKAEAVADVMRIPALPVSTVTVANAAEGWAAVEETLKAAGFARAGEIRALFRETFALRGAMLLDADTLERLEPDRARGVRATNMDGVPSPPAARKNHFAEALTLASKVLAAPGIVGEICMSDDPEYTTGYVATRQFGYRRITVMKEKGDPSGGRIFLYRGRREDAARTIDFLERRTVVVEHAPGSARQAQAAGGGRATRMERLADDLAAVRDAGLWREVRIAPPALASFASNDYLGLARDPRVAEAAAKAARDYGAGTGASRLVTGTQAPHLALERHLAGFKGTEDAIVFSTGYMANTGTISALAGKGDIVFSDALNHASIIDGCRMCGAETVVYPHLDMDALDRMLGEARARRASGTRILVVSDGVFSMDGDMLDLPRFIDICERHDAFSMVDEAHSTGVTGAAGRGLCEHFGCRHCDIMMGTLSKALGSSGGYVAGSRTLVEYLRQKARTFIFNTAPCAATMAAADAALSILESESWRVARLRENAALFAAEAGPGVAKASPASAIVPIPVGDEGKAVAISRALEAEGFLVPAIRHPTVARGQARLRAAMCSEHGRGTVAAAARAVARIRAEILGAG